MDITITTPQLVQKENRFYYNWINSLNFTINCLDGVIKDSKEKNEKNAIEIKYSEMWAD